LYCEALAPIEGRRIAECERHLLQKNGELETTGLEMAIDSRDVESDLVQVQLIVETHLNLQVEKHLKRDETTEYERSIVFELDVMKVREKER
jgi:hypothetical protein